MAGYGDNELKFLNPFSNNNIKVLVSSLVDFIKL